MTGFSWMVDPFVSLLNFYLFRALFCWYDKLDITVTAFGYQAYEYTVVFALVLQEYNRSVFIKKFQHYFAGITSLVLLLQFW